MPLAFFDIGAKSARLRVVCLPGDWCSSLFTLWTKFFFGFFFLHDFSFLDSDDRLLLMTRHQVMDRSALYHKIEVPTCMRIFSKVARNDKTTLSNMYTNDINDHFFFIKIDMFRKIPDVSLFRRLSWWRFVKRNPLSDHLPKSQHRWCPVTLR